MSSIMQVLIIEDELHAAKRLFTLLKKCRPQAELLGQVDSIEDAVAFFESKQPDLAFFDIELADGLSFKIFELAQVNCPVIFTTAYDNYAVRAFRVNGLDYLLKPIDINELQSALEKFNSKQIANAIKFNELISHFSAQVNYKKRFFVKSGNQLHFVPVEEVAYFVSSASTTFIVTNSNSRFILEHSLEELENLIDPKLFFRINRSAILGLKSIEKIDSYSNSRLRITTNPLEKEDEMIVSRQKVRPFKEWIDQ